MEAVVAEPAVVEARNHIDQIRKDKGLDSGVEELGSNVHDLTSALAVLSDQLYTQPTHFLLEFIQNADDNSFNDHVSPTISFHSTSGKLLIECNEIGFDPKNVEAICRIGQSTKKDRSKGFIGEKGIGFKSVFKIAKMVHISSNAYTFKFDRDGPLGMIAPIWSSFPGNVKPGQTQFFLQLSQDKLDQSERELRMQLKRFDSTLLLFLRNLRHISISIDDGSKTVEGKFVKDIHRDDDHGHGGEMVRLYGNNKRLRRNIEDKDYLVVRHSAAEMPFEPKRRGMVSSEVVIAFPFANETPTFFKQKAYAFLPIKESGYRFLLQGDFILIANREDVEEANDWNAHLLWALAQCFAIAVDRFNSPGAEAVRFTWIGFLQDLPVAGSNSFSPLAGRIISVLKMRKAFLSQDNVMVCPGEAVFVPPVFRDEVGNFTLAGHANVKRYLDRLLKAFINDDFETYTDKATSWHNNLARILLHLANDMQIRALPVIPLTDGSWVRAVDAHCHFETDDSKVLGRLPDGITNLSIVDKSASEGIRRRLLERIGVKDLNRVEVCRLLNAYHTTTDPTALEVDALVSHATYLFEVIRLGQHIAKPEQFWVCDVAGLPRLAKAVYQEIADGEHPKLSLLLPTEQWSSKHLHSSYTIAYKGQTLQKWSKWLESYLGVRSVVRVVNDQSNITADFRFILQNSPTEDMLEALLASWYKYDDILLSSTTIRQQLSAIEVTCEDNSKVRLGQTCLPIDALKFAAVPGIPYLRLRNAKAEKWKKLAELGVVIKADLEFYMRCFKLLQGRPVGRSLLLAIYKKIDMHITEDMEGTRQYFSSNAAIYVPPPSDVWVHKSACVWEPTPGVTGEHALVIHYSELQSFFYHHLQIRSATIERVIQQLKATIQRVPGEDLAIRKSLIYSLSNFLRRTPQHYYKLRELQDIPVMPIAGKLGFSSTRLSSINKQTWFFLDRHDQHASFKTVEAAHFADFDVESYPKLEPLDVAISKAWNMPHHSLSANVTEVKDYGPNSSMDLELTAFLRGKLKHIRRVVRAACGSGNPDTRRKLDYLHNLRVLHASEMVAKVSLSQGTLGKALEGRPRYPEALHKSLTGVGEVHFYVRSKDLSTRLRAALSDQLVWFCQIGQDKMRMLLLQIMLNDDDEVVYDMLAHEGVGGHEEQKYQPLPVQPSSIIPKMTDQRPPTAAIMNSANPTSGPLTIAQRPPLASITNNALPTVGDVSSKIKEQPSAIDLTSAELQVAAGPPDFMQHGKKSQQCIVEKRTGTKPEKIQIQGFSARGSTAFLGTAASRVTIQPVDANRTTHIGGTSLKTAPALPLGSSSGARPSSNGSDTARRSAQAFKRGLPQLLRGTVQSGAPNRVATFKSEADQIHEHAIGLKGERKVYHLLQEVFGSQFAGEDCWTSELRGLAGEGFTKWIPDDRTANYADFTVRDSAGLFTSYLKATHGMAMPPVPQPSKGRIYHLEVKSTSGTCNEPFHLSGLQMEMCQNMAGNAEAVFVIMRVYDAEAPKHGLKIYRSPWDMIQSGELATEIEGYLVQDIGAVSETEEDSAGDG